MEEKITIIKPKTGWFDINLKEIVQYKDLIYLLVKRNFAAEYKQTILGPLWYLLNPLMTSVLFTFVFGGIAGISTEGVPGFLFYMTGYCLWSYFSACITKTSNTFTGNAAIFGKVYFPRLTMPISTVIYSLVSFGIVFAMLIPIMIFYIVTGSTVLPNIYLLAVPAIVLQTAVLGLGIGIIISALTTKYRDLNVLVTFGVQLWMYVTPIVYPMSQIDGKYAKLLWLNPMTPLINNFRYAILGCGSFSWGYWGISVGVSFILFCIGVIIFSRIEKNFMDTV